MDAVSKARLEIGRYHARRQSETFRTVQIAAVTCPNCGHHIQVEQSNMSYDMMIDDENFNYTYNVSPMWYACYPDKGIRKHYGLTGREAVPVLMLLHQYMVVHREELLPMEPDNGWGSYDGALDFVNDLIKASMRHPDDVWEGD